MQTEPVHSASEPGHLADGLQRGAKPSQATLDIHEDILIWTYIVHLKNTEESSFQIPREKSNGLTNKNEGNSLKTVLMYLQEQRVLV